MSSLSSNDSALPVFTDPKLRNLARRFVRKTLFVTFFSFVLLVAVGLDLTGLTGNWTHMSKDTLAVTFTVIAMGTLVLSSIEWGFRILFTWLGLLD